MSRPLRAVMPPIVARLLPPLFDRPEIVEARSTCGDCAMCDKGTPAPTTVAYFRPDTKCCTFHPTLPNFLVGAILVDKAKGAAEGRRRIRAKIARRIGVLPHWLSAPRKVNVLQDAAFESRLFGRAPTLICPYFDARDGGLCTIWQNREGVCTTFFCKYTAGRRGYQFWKALKAYLLHVENELANYAAASVDDSLVEPQIHRLTLTIEDLEDRPPGAEDYARYWGKWARREEEFYTKCHAYVRALRPEEFREHIDEIGEGKRRLARLTERYENVTGTDLPISLIRNPKMEARRLTDAVIVTTYSTHDALSLDAGLYDALALLEPGASLAENLARLEKEHDIVLEPDLLQHLFTHDVLVPPEG